MPADSGLSSDGRAAAALAAWMAVWWLTEALPLSVTALVPVALFPPVGAASLSEAAAPYAHPLIFLFLGGFLLAAAMERWGLHRRLALAVVARAGARPGRIVAAFMGVTAFLSLWISNTAAAVMMLAIGKSVMDVAREEGSGASFAPCLALGVAYAASIGGMGTLIGTPPNALLAAFARQELGRELTFGSWLIVGLPLVATMLPACWWLLTRVLFPLGTEELAGGRKIFQRELRSLGPMTAAERRTAAVFASAALAWTFRPLLERVAPFPFERLDDPGIAMCAALSLFLIPAGGGRKGALLDWESAERLPWGVLLLFGGGLSLAAALSANGVDRWLGGVFAVMRGMPPWVLVLAATTLIVFLTELTSNTATTAAFLPVFAAAARGAGVDPYLLIFPAALGASCAFMMPVATPPNALVFASGRVTAAQMARAGWWLNLISIPLITLGAFFHNFHK